MGRVNFQVDGLACDALVVTGDTSGLVLDFTLDVAEVGEATIGDVVELCPLAGPRNVGIPLRDMGGNSSLSLLVRNVDELEDQGSTSDDATASR